MSQSRAGQRQVTVPECTGRVLEGGMVMAVRGEMSTLREREKW